MFTMYFEQIENIVKKHTKETYEPDLETGVLVKKEVLMVATEELINELMKEVTAIVDETEEEIRNEY